MTLIEMVIAISILAIIILALTGSVSAGLNLMRKAKLNEIATNLANGELEKISRLRNQTDAHAVGGKFSYENVCIVGQAPDCKIDETGQETVRGVTFDIVRSVDFEPDAVTGEPNQNAGHKLVKVTVSPANGGEPTVTAKTIISPDSSSTPAAVLLTVLDASDGSSMRQGVQMRLDTGSQQFNRISNASGVAGFYELSTGATFTLGLNDMNWMLDSCSPTTVTPDPLDEVLATCWVYKTMSLGVKVTDASNGSAITGNDYRLSVGYNGSGKFGSRGTTFNGQSPPSGTLSGTNWTLTDLGTGFPLIGNLTYNVTAWAPGFKPMSITPQAMPTGYPTSSSQSVTFAMVPAVTGTVSVSVTKGGSSAPARILITDQGSGATVVRYAYTSASGMVDVDLEPGTYTVTADPGSGTQSATVVITAAATTPQSFIF